MHNNKLVEKLELEDEELEYWERIINNMYFPFDENIRFIHRMTDL